MPTVVIIPVKSFSHGKGRLAGALDDGRRRRLGQGLAEHVAETVEAAGLLGLFVTSDAEVASWVTSLGFPSLPDPGKGLDAAAREGVVWADQAQSRWIVLHADLPLLDRSDLEVLVDLRGDVIAPSSDGGTSAISAVSPIEFSFGPGSFHRHLVQLHEPVVVTTPGFMLDVDSPMDLEAALNHPKGRWLRERMR